MLNTLELQDIRSYKAYAMYTCNLTLPSRSYRHTEEAVAKQPLLCNTRMCCHFAVSLNTLGIYERQNESNFKLSLKLRQLKNRTDAVFQHFHRCGSPPSVRKQEVCAADGGVRRLGGGFCKPPPRRNTDVVFQHSHRYGYTPSAAEKS